MFFIVPFDEAKIWFSMPIVSHGLLENSPEKGSVNRLGASQHGQTEGGVNSECHLQTHGGQETDTAHAESKPCLRAKSRSVFVA